MTTGVATRVGGGWRDGDPTGERRFADLPGRLDPELGGSLPGIRIAYETWGTLTPAGDNAVLILHALTGDSHAAGLAGWWEGLIGPGRALDTDRWFVVAPNVLGGCQGTTGPSSLAPDGKPWGSRFPPLTIRDQVEAERRLADALGLGRWALVPCGSMGGMRALEWAISHPDRVGALAVVAVGAAATAEQIGLQSTQTLAIRSDPNFRGGDWYDNPRSPDVGLGIARRFAHLSYRSEAELQQRFGREPALNGFAVQSYLDHHADKLIRRFDANSYVILTEAMNTHDVGRDRAGVRAALRRITAPTVVAGISSDRLYPPYLQQELAEEIPGCERLDLIESRHGHDGFLIETDQLGSILRGITGGSFPSTET